MKTLNILRRPIDIMLNPGLRLVYFHMCSTYLYRRVSTRWLGLLVWNFEVFIHGCHISVKCNIPKSTVLPHPIGIVVGDGVIVEEGVTIYQNVTIGVRNLKSNQYPYVGEGSVIYSGAVIAGEVVLRPKAVIPANSFIKG